MIKVYGIKTCGSVKKALSFFKNNNIDVEFCDFKKNVPRDELVSSWIKQVGIDIVFNSRGTMYRNLKLKELSLDDEGKENWLKKEFMLLKRPIVEKNNKVIAVGYDEEKYKNFI